eukprot:2810152-Rhodomonas_salina.5
MVLTTCYAVSGTDVAYGANNVLCGVRALRQRWARAHSLPVTSQPDRSPQEVTSQLDRYPQQVTSQPDRYPQQVTSQPDRYLHKPEVTSQPDRCLRTKRDSAFLAICTVGSNSNTEPGSLVLRAHEIAVSYTHLTLPTICSV